jgi:protocatechuate 3,4-dioxygenase beta subunit
MRALILLLLSCLGLGAQTATFEGVAVNALTGEPLAGVHLKLATGMFDGGGVSEAYGAMSGRDGHFAISGLKPGFYLLLPERTGFVYSQKSTGALPFPSMTFKPGEHVTDFQLKMTPRAVIQGRVVDENGDPVQAAMVEAVPLDKDAPVAARINMMGAVQTDDRGEFRISGGPGKFRLKASPGGNNFVQHQPEIRADGSTEAVYGVTFYPSTATAERATPVEAVAGRDVTGIEIRLMRQRSLSISGTVSGIPQGGGASVTLRFGESADRLFNTRSTVAPPDGNFRLQAVPPAAFYQVSAAYNSGEQRLRSPTVDVHLDGDAAEVHLTLQAGSELSGAIEIAGDPPGTPAGKRTVRLESAIPYGSFEGPVSTQTADDGAFRLTGVFPGKYKVTVQPLPENGYVGSVALDGVPQPTALDLSRGGSRLKVVLGRNAGTISGTVVDKEGQPITNTLGVVLLVQDPEHPDFAKNEIMDSGGRYTFKSVAPGKYWLLAIDALNSGDLRGEDDFKKFIAKAEPIEVHEGERLTKNVRPIAKEDADAKAKQ